MRKLQFIAVMIGSVCIVSSCHTKTPKEAIVGLWTLKGMGEDGKIDEPKEDRKMDVVFNKDGSAYTMKIEDGKRDTADKATYKLSEDGKQLTMYNRNDVADAEQEVMNIIELSDGTLKFSDKNNKTFVFKK